MSPGDESSELAAVLAGAADEQGVPGAAAGILVDGEEVVAAHGITNVEHPLPVDADTLFQVGSVSKTFTSAAVLLLAEAGALALEDPLSRHLPDLAGATGLDDGRITVERLVSHQSGFDGDHLLVNRADALSDLSGARRLFEPGTGFSYSNAGFSLAAAVVEKASGTSYEDFVRTRLLVPLGMSTACFRADDAITRRVAAPHVVSGDSVMVLRGVGWQPGWELVPVDRGAGGLVASVSHLLSWARFHMTGTARDGTRVLSQESLDRLHTPVTRANRDEEIALDWFVRRRDGTLTWGHDGMTVGYASELLIVPDRQLAVVSLTHAVNGAAVNRAVRRWALRALAGIDDADPAPDRSVRIAPHVLAGRYRWPFATIEVEAAAEPGTWTARFSEREDVTGWKPPPPPPVTLAPAAVASAVTLDHPVGNRLVPFGIGDDATASWITWGYRRCPRLEEPPGNPPDRVRGGA